jgi:ribosomal protein S18 acetylase RimI-like enzyme
LVYKIIEEEDADTWAALQNSLFSGSFNYTEVTGEEFVRMTQLDTFCRDLALFGLHNGRTVAYCVGTLLGPTGSPIHDRRLVIDGIGVVTRQRRQGFGRAILNEVLTRATALGVTRSELIVDGHNDPAIKMYRGVGYRESYRRIWYERRLV